MELKKTVKIRRHQNVDCHLLELELGVNVHIKSTYCMYSARLISTAMSAVTSLLAGFCQNDKQGNWWRPWRSALARELEYRPSPWITKHQRIES